VCSEYHHIKEKILGKILTQEANVRRLTFFGNSFVFPVDEQRDFAEFDSGSEAETPGQVIQQFRLFFFDFIHDGVVDIRQSGA